MLKELGDGLSCRRAPIVNDFNEFLKKVVLGRRCPIFYLSVSAKRRHDTRIQTGMMPPGI